MRSNHGTVSTLAALAAAVIFTMGAFDAQAYPTWEGSGLGDCSTCHGNFQANPYMPPSGDPMWTADLMSAHNAVLNDCQALRRFRIPAWYVTDAPRMVRPSPARACAGTTPSLA
jgi:hypothetical protein